MDKFIEYMKEFFSDKKNVLVVVLAIIAFFTIRHSYQVITSQYPEGTAMIQALLKDNQTKIAEFKTVLKENSEKISDKRLLVTAANEQSYVSPNDRAILDANQSVIESLKALYTANIVIKAKKLDDVPGARADFKEVTELIKSNIYVKDSDKMMKEMADNAKRLGL